jgi:peptidoglycan/LPS O-acetylase OafA/YrhL/lysophospholipase L1-like esterase
VAKPAPVLAPTTLRHVPALDGIRAVAVIGVILFHSGFSWAKGGFLGVDAFFVLSGFLITALLLGEWARTGRIHFTDFWIRRARRLLPAVVLMLAAVAAYAAFLAAPDELRQIRNDGTATVFYVANWHFIESGRSYFDAFATPSPFRHCWSLAIEEQFYFVWPVIVLVGLRLDAKRRGVLLTSTLVLAAISIAAMAVLFDDADVSRAYYGTDTRAQALLVGALLAMIWQARPVVAARYARSALHAAAAVSVCVLGWLWCTATGNAPWLYRDGFLAHALLVAIVIASAMQPRAGIVGRALAWPPLCALGKISYGVYLWHWPVFVALSPTRFDLPPALAFALRIGTTLLLAIASYSLVERPMRDRARTGFRAGLVLAAAAAASLEGLYVLALAAPPRLEAAPQASAAETVPGPPWDPGGAASGPIRVMLVGDSVASSLAGGLERASVARGFVFWNATLPGCGLASDYGERWVGTWASSDRRCVPGWRERWKQQIEAGRPDVVVLLSGAQDTYDRRVGETVSRFDEDAGAQLARADLEEAIGVLSGRGAAVVLLTAPHYRLGWPQTLEIDRSYLNPLWIDRYNRIVSDTAEASGDVAIAIDLAGILQPEGAWAEEIAGVRVRTKDRVHLTPAGADIATAQIMDAVIASGQAARARCQAGACPGP